jgi:hypothetical protein
MRYIRSSVKILINTFLTTVSAVKGTQMKMQYKTGGTIRCKGDPTIEITLRKTCYKTINWAAILGLLSLSRQMQAQ